MYNKKKHKKLLRNNKFPPIEGMGFSHHRRGKMLKELSVAVVLTLIFSIGVGVLFVRTIIEMVELLFNGDLEVKEANKKEEGLRA